MAYWGNEPAKVAMKVGSGVITATEIQDASISTADIANDAITPNQLDDDGTGFQVGTLGIGTAVSGSEKLTVGGTASFSGEVDAASLDISGDVDVDGTLETDALTIGGTTLAETIADTVGAMVGSNTETGISVTYEDSDNTLDFALSTITSLGTISTGVWNGTAIASAYLDADTAHLSGTQTFTGAKTFTGETVIDGGTALTGSWGRSLTLQHDFPMIAFTSEYSTDAWGAIGYDNSTGMKFFVNSSDGDIPTNGTLGLTILDNGEAIFGGDIKNSSDSKSIYVGASNDLRIVHDGSNSYIDHENTGDLKIRSRRHNGDIRFYNENSSGTETLTLQLTGASNANFAGDITISKGSALFNLQEPSGSQAYLYSGGSFTALRTTSSHPLHFSANYSSGDDALVLGTDGNVTVGAANVGKKVRVNTVTARHLDGLDDDTTWNTGNLYLNYDHDGDTFINVGGGKLRVGGTMGSYPVNIRGYNECVAVMSSDAHKGSMSLRTNSTSTSSTGDVQCYWATKASMAGSGTDVSPGLWATAGNNLHLGIGSTQKLTVTSAGYVLHSAQPAFHAYGMSGHVYANTDDADTILFNATDLNQGSHYSTSTGKFTAPVAGVYHFYFNAMYKHVDGDFHITLRINGTVYTIANNHQEVATDLHTWVQTSTHLTIALSANDYVTCQMGSSENASTYLYGSGRYSSFGGHLVA